MSPLELGSAAFRHHPTLRRSLIPYADFVVSRTSSSEPSDADTAVSPVAQTPTAAFTKTDVEFCMIQMKAPQVEKNEIFEKV